MPLTTIGPRGYKNGAGVATLSFSPLTDRAAIIRRIILTGVSADDTWNLTCDGRNVGAFLELTVGNQQLLGSKTTLYPKDQDIFQYLKSTYGIDLIYPVPQGTTFTIASASGATANISLEYTEEAAASVVSSMMNHPRGNHFVLPVYARPPASVTVAGDTAYASEVKPDYVPSMFLDGNYSSGWTAKLLGLFAEGAGVNTFSGAADHQSVTDHLTAEFNGQQMFTRDATGGIPVVGAPSAAGSANTVYGSIISALGAFQEQDPASWDYFDPSLIYREGAFYRWRLNITGSLTGGADYSKAVLAAIVDLVQMGA